MDEIWKTVYYMKEIRYKRPYIKWSQLYSLSGTGKAIKTESKFVGMDNDKDECQPMESGFF